MALTDDDSVADQTAAWFSRLTGGEATDADRADFRLWLDASPKHRAAYADLNAMLSDVDDAFAHEFASEALLDMTDAPAERIAPAPPRERRPAWKAMAAAAAIVATVGSIATWQMSGRDEPGYASVATQVGRRDTVKLADGSTIELNTASTLRYRLDGKRRSIFLDTGEAYFQVAKDGSRPFVVTLPAATVTAVGTAFNIRVVGAATEVTVTEGVVTLDHLKVADAASYRLAAGDVALLKGSALDIKRSVQTASGIAWTQGQLVYQDRTLRDVVEDLDRYFPGRLIVDAGRADRLRVSAVVNLTNEDEVLRALASQLPISVTRLPNGEKRIGVEADATR